MLPENWDTVRAFMVVQTQWRYAPNGHVTGLDYAGVRVACSAMGIRFKAVFEGVQVMEWEALAQKPSSTQDGR